MKALRANLVSIKIINNIISVQQNDNDHCFLYSEMKTKKKTRMDYTIFLVQQNNNDNCFLYSEMKTKKTIMDYTK